MKVEIEGNKTIVTMSTKQAKRVKDQLGKLFSSYGLDLERLFNKLADVLEVSSKDG